MLAAFFHTIYYVVTSWSENKVKIYLKENKQRDLQNEAQEALFLEPRKLESFKFPNFPKP
jgi:hypothetical protein